MKRIPLAVLSAAFCAGISSVAAGAVQPIVVWDGASPDSNFSTLTRTVGDNTYTLDTNEMNTVASDGSYIQIGSENAKKAVVLSVQNSDASITNGFGKGQSTVIMKVSDMPVASGSNRALISLMDGNLYKRGGNQEQDNGAVVGVCGNIGWGAFIWQGGVYGNFYSGVFDSSEKTVALSYSRGLPQNDGTAFYVNGLEVMSNSGLKGQQLDNNLCGIALGGVDTDGSGMFFAMTGMKIKAIAVFKYKLTAQEICEYTFPSETAVKVSGDTTVSAINGLSAASDLYVIVDDGATVTGDAAFTASSVHFICNGSMFLVPPAGNTASLDFTRVTGTPTIVYEGVMPSSSGNTFTSTTVPEYLTDSAQWKGTIWIRNNTNVANFKTDGLGNANSLVKVSGLKGYLYAPGGNAAHTNTVPVELDNWTAGYAFDISNGFSANSDRPLRSSVFNKIKGSGLLKGSGGNSGAGERATIVIRDWSEFTGNLDFGTKVVVFGESIPDNGTSEPAVAAGGGQLYVKPEAEVAIPENATWNSRIATVGGVLKYAADDMPSVSLRFEVLEGGVVEGPVSGVPLFTNAGSVTGSVNVASGNVATNSFEITGDTTIAGTLAGAGSIYGNLELSDGATLDFPQNTSLPSISGNLTATGDITVNISTAVASAQGLFIAVGGAIDISGARFTVLIDGSASSLSVVKSPGGLRVLSGMTIRLK